MCSWSQISFPVELDPGFSVYETVKPMKALILGLTGSDIVYHLSVGEPVHYFSFDRYGQRFGAGLASEDYNELVPGEGQAEDRVWLYSVFGYALGHAIVALRYQPSRELSFLVLPRPVQFPW